MAHNIYNSSNCRNGPSNFLDKIFKNWLFEPTTRGFFRDFFRRSFCEGRELRTPKWSQNDPKIILKWSQHDPKMILKWPQNDPKLIPKWFQNDPKIVLKWSQNYPKMIPNLSQNDFKMIPKLVYYSPGDRAQKVIPGGAKTNESFWKYQNNVKQSILRFLHSYWL